VVDFYSYKFCVVTLENDTIVDRNEDTASFGSFSVISEYIILICWYDLRKMDRIVEPSFCANDNIDLSSFDKIVQESFLISDALEIDV
jgi:hypothetical protein